MGQIFQNLTVSIFVPLEKFLKFLFWLETSKMTIPDREMMLQVPIT